MTEDSAHTVAEDTLAQIKTSKIKVDEFLLSLELVHHGDVEKYLEHCKQKRDDAVGLNACVDRLNKRLKEPLVLRHDILVAFPAEPVLRLYVGCGQPIAKADLVGR